MPECGISAFPLTTAQRGLWFTQKIAPEANMNIAESVEIHGMIEPELFQQALGQVVVEAEQLRVNIVESDGAPRQISKAVYDYGFPYIDTSGEPDPKAAAGTWMRHEMARPVDLVRDPLWVSALLKTGDTEYFWYHRAHHLVCDGYGGGLVARRLAEVYTAYAEGREPRENHFCTVENTLKAEAEYRQSRHFERDREYWRKQLAGLPEAVTLSRSARRHGLSSSLLRSSGRLSPETTRATVSLARAAGVSVPQVLISFIAAYYARATGAQDLVFGMPVSGRISRALRSAVGVCANMTPIRLRFERETTVFDLCAQVSRVMMQGLRHQQYRYEDLRRDLGLVGYDQNIAWLGGNIEPFDYRLSFGGAETTLRNLSNSSTEDLMVFVYDRGTGEGLQFDFDANPMLYTAGELDEHRRRFVLLLEGMLERPDTPLRRVDVLGKAERAWLVADWNATAGDMPQATLPSMVAAQAEKTPDAAAVVFGDTVLSYRQLQERSAAEANRLAASGVRPGDIVAVALRRSEQLPVALLAILRTGAAYLPLDLESPMERTRFVLEDARPVAVLVETGLEAEFALRGVRTLRWRGDGPDSGAAADASRLDERAYVLYTSGSTGQPKGVEIAHRNLSNFLEGMRRLLQPKTEERFLALTTLIFDIAGLELFLPLTTGSCVVIAGGEAVHNPPALAGLIRRAAVTHIQATPSVWRILLATPGLDVSHVHALVGGEALPAELAARLRKQARRVTQLYGPTETTIWSTAFELEQEVGDAAPPIGRPILNTQVYVLDSERELAPTGCTGELYIGGAGVARGYLNRAELTQERFVADPFAKDGSHMFRTGDLVRWTPDGLLEFLGRADDQVKINGHRIELGEIESVMAECDGVAQAAVTVLRQADGSGARLAGYLVRQPGNPLDVEEVRAFLEARLPGYMIPASLTVLEAMPLTPNGKLDRKALPPPNQGSGERTAGPVVQPATAVEQKLAALWRQVLQCENVGIHENFFEVGGDSLRAAEMAAAFPAWFGMELPLGKLLHTPTIAGMAQWVERAASGQTHPLGVVLALRRSEGDGQQQRPLFCIHPMIGFSMGFASLLRHLNEGIPVYGLQSRGLDRAVSLPGSVEEIAADYYAQIRQIQPEGPYRIVGRSMGGLIGYCIAEQMQEQGQHVELLAMIDTLLFTAVDRVGVRTEADEVRAALAFLDIVLPHESMPRTLHQLNRFLLEAGEAGATSVAYGAARLVREIGKTNPRFLEQLSAVMLNNVAVARQFVPRKLAVNLLYFQAMKVSGDLHGFVDRSPSAWQPFVEGRIEVHPLECHHEAVLEPGPAAEIGRVLQNRLSRTFLGEERRWVAHA
jgi:enterobactin synthetase component F